jgi:ABC-2 type transport system permease protein
MSAPLSFTQATRTVAARELTERWRDKSFWISTLVTLVILAVVLLLPTLFDDDRSYRVAYGPDTSPGLAAAAQAAADQLDVTIEEADLSGNAAARALEAGDLDAYVTSDRILVHEELDNQLGAALQTAHQQVTAAQRLRAEGLDPAVVERARNVPPLAVEAQQPVDPEADRRSQVAFIGSLLLYAQIIGYCMWVAFGIVEEKSSRVVELILSAIPTRALLAGKILGIGLLGLLQLVLIAVFGLGVGNVTGMVEVTSDLLTPVAFVLVWFVLGYAFYSAVFAAAAARVSRQEELQNVVGPMTMLLMVSFFATFYVSSNPDGLISRLLAVVPPFSALCAPVRMAGGLVPWWETGLAVGLMAAAIAALVVLGARIYDGAILRMGAKVSLKEAWLSGRRAAPEVSGRAG